MTDELKPCPFCGSTDVGGASGIVHCYKCSAQISMQNTNTHAACEKWNTRHLSTQQVNAIKASALREFARKLEAEAMDTKGTTSISQHYNWLLMLVVDNEADRLENTGDE